MRRLLLPILLALLPAAATAATAGKDAAAKASAELKEITAELNALDTWLGAADRQRNKLQQELAASDRQVAAASAAVDEAAATVAEAEAALGELRKETDALREIQAQQARHIATHLSAAHRLAGEDFFKLILNQESPETFDRMIRYHRYFSAARLESLQAYQQTLDQLETNERALQQRAEEADRLRAEREARQAELLVQRDERKTLIAKLDEEAEDKAIERERLRADRQRLESLLAELQRKALGLDGRTFAQSQGRLPWPLEGRVVHGFGKPRAEGRMTWNGILIAAEDGAQFRAVQRGRIVFADWLRGFGLMTIVDHGSGFMTLYGQAEALSRRVGDTVEAGEVLGRAGRSGGQKEPGVYFEIRQNGRARDPAAWLRKR
jgi:septal ring factor EnvC (AmiA/AmiB activator)